MLIRYTIVAFFAIANPSKISRAFSRPFVQGDGGKRYLAAKGCLTVIWNIT